MKISTSFLSYFLVVSVVFLSLTAQAQRQPKNPIKIGLFTDVQYCPCKTYGSRNYVQSLEKAANIVSDFNKQKVNFALHLGDLIDKGLSSYDSVMPLVRQLKMPIYFAYGNHDYSIPDSLKGSLNAIHNQKAAYFSFQKAGWRFIVLNTNDVSVYAHPKMSAQQLYADSIINALKKTSSVNAYPWNGGVGVKQMQWLTSELQHATKAHQKVLIFGHHPIWPAGAENALNDTQLLELFAGYECIKAYFCGHNHAGNYGQKGKISFVNLQGVVETPNTNAYCVLELLTNSIVLKGYGREPSRVINF